LSDYDRQKVHLSMPNYVSKVLACCCLSPPPPKQQDQPNPNAKPTYGEKSKYAQGEDNSHALNKTGKKFIQEACRVFLILALAVNGGLLPALCSLESQQPNPTEITM
jgi:hypothetical protein